MSGSFFRRIDLAGISALKKSTLDYLVEKASKTIEDEAAVSELHRQIAQHQATIAQINQKLHEVSIALQEKESRDYQSVMALQATLAGLKDLDPGFAPIYEACKPFTMTSAERLYGLYKAVEYIVNNKIPGDLVETGVWRGGSMMLVAQTLLALGEKNRRLFLFDTYEGHPKPDAELDVDLWGNRAIEDWQRHQKTDEGSGWGYVSLEEVRANMQSTGYPMENVVCVKGMVEETVAENSPGQISLLRLDTDWYQSTKITLEICYPRLSPNGVLIIDDYGHYRGQRQAVDAYFRDRQMPLLNRLDYSCRLAVKPTDQG
ncbi:MAG: TylF/MycF/NovP-related O-methyltransferase [Gemmatimonas sp.]